MDNFAARLSAATTWANDGRVAPGTRDAYRRNWRSFATWCQHVGRPALPCEGKTLEAYCGWLRAGRPQADGERRRDPVKAGTIDLHVCAIVRAHRDAGHPSPRTERITNLLVKMRLEDGPSPPMRDIVSLETVRAIVTAQPAPSVAAVRNRFVLQVGNRLKLNLHLLASIRPDNVEVSTSLATLVLQDGRRLSLRYDDPEDVAAIKALEALLDLLPDDALYLLGVRSIDRRSSPEPVVAPVPGYVGLHNAQASRAKSIHIAGYRSMPYVAAGLAGGDVQRLGITLDKAQRQFVRDRTYLLVVLHAGARGCEPASLDWTDVTFVPDRGVVLRMSATKEQGANPREVFVSVPVADDPQMCAVVALAEWKRVSGSCSGPVFPSAKGGGHLQRSGVHALFGRLFGDQEGNLGGGSLRPTFVTETLAAGFLLLDVAAKTRHSSWQTLSRYHRPDGEVRARAAREIASQLSEPDA